MVAQTLDEPDWVGSNASLLLGTLSTGVVMALPYGESVVDAFGTWYGLPAESVASVVLVMIAVVLSLVPHGLPDAPPVAPPSDDAFAEDRSQAAPRALVRFPSARWSTVLALSWYWAIGATLLELLPSYVGRVVGAGPAVTTWFLLTFGIGSAIGTVMAAVLSRRRVELGLVPLGSIGLSVVCADLWFVGSPFGPEIDELVTWQTFVTTFAGLRISLDLVGLAISGVFVAVPLVSYLQLRSEADERGRILGANQRLNAIVGLLATLLLVLWLGEGIRPYDVLLGIALTNLLVAAYVYHTIAEFLLRFVAWVVSFGVYRLKVQGPRRSRPRDPRSSFATTCPTSTGS